MYAAQQMLVGLTPCSVTTGCTSSTGFDTVALFTFPNMTIGTASGDTDGSCNVPAVVPYTAFSPASTANILSSGYTNYTPVVTVSGHGKHQTTTTTDMTYQITTSSTGILHLARPLSINWVFWTTILRIIKQVQRNSSWYLSYWRSSWRRELSRFANPKRYIGNLLCSSNLSSRSSLGRRFTCKSRL